MAVERTVGFKGASREPGWRPLAAVAGLDGMDRGDGRGELAGIQRARMVAAMVEVARERGVGQATVSRVVARSGVSRKTFYELFEDREACFLAAFDEAVKRAAASALPAYRSGGSWRERIRGGLGALLEFIDDQPGLADLCVVDALGAGSRALERRAEVLRVLIDAVDEGRGEARGGSRLTRLTAEGVVGAVLGVLHTRLAVDAARSGGGIGSEDESRTPRGSTSGESQGPVARARPRRGGPRVAAGRPVVNLFGPLMGMVVLPYLGPAAAAREATRPAPRRRRVAQRQEDPLRDLDMRLTYRTVRVLVAIAESPGASNRLIANASGVADQGQISKLLARLEHLGLVVNTCLVPARGEPNAWRLTPRGQEIEGAIRAPSISAGAR